MANPQIENGYTRIANEIMEALAGIRISGEARQVLDVIFRKTYGFQKKEDVISLSQFCLLTKIGKTHVSIALKKLATMNIIITKKGNALGNIHRFNKDYSSWKPLPKKVTFTKKGNDLYQKRYESLPKKGNTKEKKETITKETTSGVPPQEVFSLQEEVVRMEENPRRDINIVALYFDKRKPDIKNKDQLHVAIKRHLRAAKDLCPFTNEQILDAIPKAKKLTEGWTLETLTKVLTK